MIVCLRCGEKNPADEQFCGTCGAFLEWRGEARPEDAAGATTAGTEAPLIRCARCGTANTVGRTFCQSCGERLPKVVAAAAATAAPTALAAEVTSPPVVSPVKPRPAGPPTRAREPASGSTPWGVLIAGGLVIGVAVAAFMIFRGGDGLQSSATNAPGGAASASPSASPARSAGVPGSSGGPADVTLAAGLYADLDAGVLSRENSDAVDLFWGVAGTEGVLHATNGAMLAPLPASDPGDAEGCREIIDAGPVVDLPVNAQEGFVLCVTTSDGQVGRLTVARADGQDLTMNYGVFAD